MFMRALNSVRRGLLVAVAMLSACSQQPLQPPVAGACRNAELTEFDGLVIIAPHPDDEVLGFAGLAGVFIEQGKPVRTVVVTDGDAYCSACALWSTGSVNGKACDASLLSNLATPEIDSLAEVRRQESIAAAKALGRPAPEFLTYPDTGLGMAWANSEAGNADKLLRRTDFSSCSSCGDCMTGYGMGPETQLSAKTLTASLDRILGRTTDKTLIATTHWLDSHSDHAALGAFVSERVAAAEKGRTVAYAVIHANTAKDHASSECWYPGPAAAECSCFDEARVDSDPGWLAALRAHRERPDWPQVLPDDVDYGEPWQLCLDEEMRVAKPLAIDAFGTQLGTVGLTPGLLPDSRKGLLDCSAYLRSFGRRTEVFVVRRAETP
jgi:LmbE family N-acetylglucosaminyl deacetylase